MTYYQAVYQKDAHGFVMVYSRKIWKKEEDAREFLYELSVLSDCVYDSWVIELQVEDPV